MRSIRGRLKSSETLSSVWPDERSFEGTMFRFRFGNSALLETWRIIEIAKNVLRVSRVFEYSDEISLMKWCKLRRMLAAP